MRNYCDDIEKYELELYCHECGQEDLAYDRTVSNAEIWHCKKCKSEVQVSHKPNEDDY